MDLLGYPLFFSISYWCGKKYDKATFFSEKDILTNLYNRRFVIHSFDKIIALADRTNSKLFVLVIDCDNFKDINDLNGHAKGDIVLTSIGKILVSSTRNSDIVARWGGDEFLVIGHYKEEAGLETVVERLESELKILSNQLKMPVIVSIGSAIFPDHNTNLIELIKIADQNMYNNKWMKRSNSKA